MISTLTTRFVFSTSYLITNLSHISFSVICVGVGVGFQYRCRYGVMGRPHLGYILIYKTGIYLFLVVRYS